MYVSIVIRKWMEIMKRNENRLFIGKKISTLPPRSGRAGNSNIPMIFDIDQLYDFVEKNSTLVDNNCWLWNGSYSKNGYGGPQIVLRSDDGKTKTWSMRQAWYMAMKREHTNGKYTRKPKCGFIDCVNPDHQSFLCK